MKKIISFMLIIGIMFFMCVGCSASDESTTDNDDNDDVTDDDDVVDDDDVIDDDDSASTECGAFVEGVNKKFMVNGEARAFILNLPDDAKTLSALPVIFN